MMEQMMQEFASMGIVGVIAYYLFKNTLDEKKQDRELHRTEVKEIRQMYDEELREAREMYKQELEKDRVVYVNSINSVVTRIETVEDDVKLIMDKVGV